MSYGLKTHAVWLTWVVVCLMAENRGYMKNRQTDVQDLQGGPKNGTKLMTP